jgi:ferritin-like protein
MTDYHEPTDELSGRDRDVHRALASLKEEIEAVDWYHQRVVRTADESLRSVLAHNRDEEMEHAAMTLEWLRRNVEAWDRNLSRHLFSEGPIAERGEASSSENSLASSLQIGSLKGEENGKKVAP